MKNPKTLPRRNLKAAGKPETEQEQEDAPEHEATFKGDADICQQLMSRYSTSSAPQHLHLLAPASAIRSILSADSLPLTPPLYFAASIENLSKSETLDSTAVGALLSLVSILAPLIPGKEGIKDDKAREAVAVLVRVVDGEMGGLKLGVGSVRGLVRCLGILIIGFCNLEDWGSVKDGFQALVKLSLDKRPKVRRSAQECIEKVFKSFGSSSVRKEASKLVLSLLESCKPMAHRLNDLSVEDGSKDEALSKPEHLEVLHVLNLVKIVVPYLTVKISSKVLSELVELMRAQFSVLARSLFKVIEAFLEASEDRVIDSQIENIVNCLCLYVSVGEKNPVGTIISAIVLLRLALGKLQAQGPRTLMKNLIKVCSSVAGLLAYDGSTAGKASDTLKELIKNFIDVEMLLIDENQLSEDVSQKSKEADLIRSMCSALENALSLCNGIPNEHLLGVISVLFQKLRESSYIYMRSITLKLADLRKCASSDTLAVSHLDHCIGSAVIAMGPERILALFPISFNADDYSCSNIWLIPLLKNYVVGASLGYYVEHIVPIAKSFQRASRKVKKNAIGEDLHAHARDLWELLCAFCRYPTDTHKKFESLAELMITFLRKDSFMHQTIAVALQALVNQNTHALNPGKNAGESNCTAAQDSDLEFMDVPTYPKKIATRNIRALASHSTELLRALADIYVCSSPEKRLRIKDAIRSLASIIDSSVTKEILTSLCERFQLVNGVGQMETEKNIGDDMLTDKEQGSQTARGKDDHRLVILELASSLVKGANKDLIDLIYGVIACTFEANDVTYHCQAYHTLTRILEEHTWFCFSRSGELIDLLLRMKPPSEVESLRNRLACFHILLVHLLKIRLDEEDTKAFLILNEIIVTLKDKTDKARKVSYDTLLMISSHLRDRLSVDSDELYCKMINMILGYLSSSSPHMKSGAVSALSLLVYNDPEICAKMPDLVPSLLSLLQSKAVEIIKAVLGFVKVLVSCLQVKDLKNLLSDIMNRILPWSLVSRNHFRSKVTVILEIVIRKCGTAAVESVTPNQHKSFVKTVSKNRHHKSITKEAGTTDAGTMIEDSSTKRVECHKHNEPGSAPQANGTRHHRKRKWGKSQSYNPSNFQEHHKSTADGYEGGKRAKFGKGDKRTRDRSEDGGIKKNFGKHGSGRKRKWEPGNTGKKGEVVSKSSSPGSANKFHRHNKVWKK